MSKPTKSSNIEFPPVDLRMAMVVPPLLLSSELFGRLLLSSNSTQYVIVCEYLYALDSPPIYNARSFFLLFGSLPILPNGFWMAPQHIC